MMCSDIFFMDDWQYLATLFQDFIICLVQFTNSKWYEKKEKYTRGKTKTKDKPTTHVDASFKIINGFSKNEIQRKHFKPLGLKKKKKHHGLTFIPTNTFNKKETDTHTKKEKKRKNTGQVTDWQKTIQHRWERYKNNVYLLDFLKGAFPNGSEESEPDMTKSSLLLTFDIPEKKILNQKQYLHLT